MRKQWRFGLALSGWLAVACVVQGQTVRVLQPGAYVTDPGEKVELSVHEAASGERLAWPGARVRWMFYRRENAVTNWSGADVEDGEASIIAPEAGCAQIGVDLEPAVEEIGTTALAEFLSAKGNGEIGRIDAPSVPVRRVESMTTLIRVRDGRTEDVRSPLAVRKSGQRVEIRLLDDATAAMVGSDVFVRVYVGDTSGRHLRVYATPEGGAAREFLTDDKGIGHFRLDRAGRWRVEVHLLEDAEGEATLWSGTLTFEVPEGRE